MKKCNYTEIFSGVPSTSNILARSFNGVVLFNFNLLDKFAKEIFNLFESSVFVIFKSYIKLLSMNGSVEQCIDYILGATALS